METGQFRWNGASMGQVVSGELIREVITGFATSVRSIPETIEGLLWRRAPGGSLRRERPSVGDYVAVTATGATAVPVAPAGCGVRAGGVMAWERGRRKGAR